MYLFRYSEFKTEKFSKATFNVALGFSRCRFNLEGTYTIYNRSIIILPIEIINLFNSLRTSFKAFNAKIIFGVKLCYYSIISPLSSILVNKKHVFIRMEKNQKIRIYTDALLILII